MILKKNQHLKKGKDRHCEVCNKIFYAHKYRIDAGKAQFCSRTCSYKGRKYFVPWNKGIKGLHLSPSTEFKKGDFVIHRKTNCKCFRCTGIAWNKGLPHMQNEKHPQWKGDDVGYGALHTWVKRKRGNAKICEQCSSTKNVHWANKSHEYKRDLSDWIPLCLKCHRKYDGWLEKMKKARPGHYKVL